MEKEQVREVFNVLAKDSKSTRLTSYDAPD